MPCHRGKGKGRKGRRAISLRHRHTQQHTPCSRFICSSNWTYFQTASLHSKAFHSMDSEQESDCSAAQSTAERTYLRTLAREIALHCAVSTKPCETAPRSSSSSSIHLHFPGLSKSAFLERRKKSSSVTQTQNPRIHESNQPMANRTSGVSRQPETRRDRRDERTPPPVVELERVGITNTPLSGPSYRQPSSPSLSSSFPV